MRGTGDPVVSRVRRKGRGPSEGRNELEGRDLLPDPRDEKNGRDGGRVD